MKKRKITLRQIELFEKHLWEEEKSPHTVGKYVRDVRAFYEYLQGEPFTKAEVKAYKDHLAETGYAPVSINSMLSSLNSLFRFLNMENCSVKCIRIQRKIYCSEDEELTRDEYVRLVKAAGEDSRLGCLLETICSTGIRISELQYFTVEAVRKGKITVSSKNKIRSIIIPSDLQKVLKEYIRKNDIRSGTIFRTKGGKAIDRSNIWLWMKRLCEKAQVLPSKVFPHNLRKLFSRTFYAAGWDIATLADILGHSNINTTRLYIMSTGSEHQKKIDKMDLVISA